jgi:hypothetical protein
MTSNTSPVMRGRNSIPRLGVKHPEPVEDDQREIEPALCAWGLIRNFGAARRSGGRGGT